jgi:hypothetical protein
MVLAAAFLGALLTVRGGIGPLASISPRHKVLEYILTHVGTIVPPQICADGYYTTFLPFIPSVKST